MIGNMIKKKKFAIVVSVTLLSVLMSCTSVPLTAGQGNQNRQESKVINNSKAGASITLKITTDSFGTSASKDGESAKTQADVQSYSAFLTTNKTSPFAVGANPNGDGVMVSVDKGTTGPPVSITLTNLPVGGPYFAVVAAFNAPMNNIQRKNITNPNKAITGTDNKWSISLNTVTVLSNLSLSFSDQKNLLEVKVQLENTLPPVIETEIIPQSGNSAGTLSAS